MIPFSFPKRPIWSDPSQGPPFVVQLPNCWSFGLSYQGEKGQNPWDLDDECASFGINIIQREPNQIPATATQIWQANHRRAVGIRKDGSIFFPKEMYTADIVTLGTQTGMDTITAGVGKKDDWYFFYYSVDQFTGFNGKDATAKTGTNMPITKDDYGALISHMQGPMAAQKLQYVYYNTNNLPRNNLFGVFSTIFLVMYADGISFCPLNSFELLKVPYVGEAFYHPIK